MMKFRKGNSVEVLRREHDPYGFWIPGTIVSVYGNDYVVRYKYILDDDGEPALEKVLGVDVRPLPLHETGTRWSVGDTAEVFDNQCWRVGKIAKVLPKNGFVVRLFGSAQLKEFHQSNVRKRRSWHDNQWSVAGKVAGYRQFTTKNNSKNSLHLLSSAPSLKVGRDFLLGEKDELGCHDDDHDNPKMYFRMGTLKRCSKDSYKTNSRGLVNARSHKKRKSSTFVGEWHTTRVRTPPLSRQVADFSFSRIQLNEKLTEMDAKMVKETTDQFYVSSAPLLSNEDSDQCSVASCGSNDFDDYTRRNIHKSADTISNDSDAESSFPSWSGKKHKAPSPRHKLEVDIHELELHAYESTVQALYALGPLSWDQESLLTNLRLSLNISDDEHLLQLRYLMSAQVVNGCFPCASPVRA